MRAAVRVAACATLVAAQAAVAQSLEAIPLKFRTADDVIAIIQPLVEPGGVVTGAGDVLLVRASAANVQQIRDALAVIDRAPRHILITVGQATASHAGRTSVRGSATVGGGDVQVGVNRPPAADPGAAVAVQELSTRDDIRAVGSVRALEGSEAYVMVGESRPTSTVTVAPGWHGPAVAQTTEYRDAQTGFYVTPRVAGDRVTLEIAPRQQRFRSRAGGDVIQTQGAAATVSGRLGEWIEIGGTLETRDASETGILTWGTHSGSSQYSAWVKVDAVP